MIIDYLKNEKVELSIRQAAKNDALVCGDSYYYVTTNDYFICVLADGLGSGELAHNSSRAVIEVVDEYHQLDLEHLFDKCNQVLVHKRGAAVAVLKVFFNKQQFQYISVGNIRFFLLQPSINKIIYPLPVSGFLAGRMLKYKCQTFQYEPSSRFVLYSDGIDLKDIKSVLIRNSSIVHISEDVWNSSVAYSDDRTFLIGSLLQ